MFLILSRNLVHKSTITCMLVIKGRDMVAGYYFIKYEKNSKQKLLYYKKIHERLPSFSFLTF